MIVGVDAPPCTEDKGADRDTRRRPCAKRTWCVLDLGHAGWCVETPRHAHPAPDFGPNRSKTR